MSVAASQSKREIWDLKWIREPSQTRSERTRAHLLDATATVLEHEGVDGLTIAKIATHAGCSVGTFYHHFEDKRTAIYAVLDRAANERILTAREGLQSARWEGVNALGIIEGYIRFTLKMAKRNPGVLQARRRLCMEDPEIDRRVKETEREKIKLIISLLTTRINEVSHPRPRYALAMVMELVSALLERRIRGNLPGGRTVAPKSSESDFVEEVLQMASAYLQLKP